MTASSVGSAVKGACAALKEKLADLAVKDKASKLFGLDPKDLGAEGSRLFSTKDPAKSEPYAAILSRSGQRALEAGHDAHARAGREHYSTHSFGAHFVEVRVDEDTGVVRVARVVSAFGVGKILNTKTARSQLMGGVVWGIGLALQEETVRDRRTGRVVTKSLADYVVPVNADVPEIEVIVVDEEDSVVNEVGAKGVGEIGIVGMGAAVANAIYHATGRRVRDLPITLDKLL